MNKDTAKHLNTLRLRAAPTNIKDDCVEFANSYSRFARGEAALQHILDVANAAITEALPRLQREEIIRAAKEQTKAGIFTGGAYFSYGVLRISVNGQDGHDIDNQKKLWAMILPAVKAAIEAQDSKYAEEYETYRVACEQGVAVPPATGEPAKS